jgi:serine/threonine protein kinase
MRYYCLACEKLIEVDSDDPKALSECPVCKGELEDGGLAPGTEINGYEIVEELGRGSYGIVYCAKQLNLERDVALKILSRNHEEEDFVINFFREARAAAGLSHPNVVQAYDAGITDDGTCYFAMEMVDGETVDDKLENEGALRADEAYNIALKIASAMEYAWDRRKLTHGDIKPENIIISRRGEPKLADLGLAKSAFDDDFGHIAATPLYAPPEVIKRNVDSVNVQTDIYSFGGTVYHMFAGVPPFNEDDSEKVMKMHLHDKHEPLYKRVPVITRSLSDFVDCMLAKDPAERPESWSEIVAFLEDSAEDSFRVVESDNTTQLTRTNRIERLIPALLVAILIGVTGWFIWDYFSSDSDTKGGEQNGTDSSIAIPAPKKIPNETRWLRLKLKLAKSAPGEACKKIDSFLQRFQILTPAVKNDIKNTRDYYAKAEADRLKQFAFEQKVHSQYDKLMEDIEFARGKNVSNKDKQQTVNRVNAFLNQIEDDDAMAAVLGRGKRMTLSGKVKEIEKKVQRRRRKQIQHVQQKQSKVWEEYKEAQTQRNREIESMFKEIIQSNLWYQSLNRFITLPAASRSRQVFKKCLSDVPQKRMSAKQKGLYKFATTLYPAKIDLLNILIAHRNDYIGKELPWVDREHGGGDFKVKRVDKNYVFMYGKIAEGAYSGFKLYWKKMSESRQYLILGKWLLLPGSKLTREEKIAISFWILEKKGQRTFYSYVGRYLKPEDALNCRNLIHELLTSRREYAAAKAFKSIQKNWMKHDYNVTAEEISEFNKHFAMTQCLASSKKLIEKLNRQLMVLSPIPRALSGATASSRLLDRSDWAKMLTETTYVANHTLDLMVVKEVSRVKIMDNLKSAFTQISAKAGRRRKLAKSGTFTPLHAAIMVMKMRRRYLPTGLKECYNVGLRFYAGDLQTAARDNSWLNKLLAKSRSIQIINPSFLLGAGMVADLYMTTREKQKISSLFDNIIRKNSGRGRKGYLEHMSRVVASEYAMLTRQYAKVPRLLDDLDADSKITSRDLNEFHMYRLLAAASAVNATPDDLKKIDLFYQKLQQNIDKKTKKPRRFNHDALWVTAVIELFDDDSSAFERLPAISQCTSPKLSAALLSSIVAISEPSSGLIHKTVKLCNAAVGDNVSATELWYRMMLLEFVGAQSPNELFSLIQRYDNDKRAGAQPYVSRMVYVASIIRLLSGETNLKTEAGIFKSFHYRLNVALPGEQDSQLLFSGKLNAAKLDKMAAKYGVKSIYWPAMLGATIAIKKNQSEADAYIKVLQKYSASLLPEERLLLQRLPLVVKSVWKIKK